MLGFSTFPPVLALDSYGFPCLVSSEFLSLGSYGFLWFPMHGFLLVTMGSYAWVPMGSYWFLCLGFGGPVWVRSVGVCSAVLAMFPKGMFGVWAGVMLMSGKSC